MNFNDEHEKIMVFAGKNNLVICIKENEIQQNFWTNYDLMARIDNNLKIEIEKTFYFDNITNVEQKEIDKLIDFLKSLGFKEGE